MNATFKYPGSKWRIADWIISFFPKHHSYLEPFFGSGAVFFNKERSAIETINDLCGDVTNLFDWIRKDPERLARTIYYIPYARDIFERAFAVPHPEYDSFKRAVGFLVRMMMAHGFRTTGERNGWKKDVQGREAAYAAKQWCALPQVIEEAAERLRGVQIENRPAVELIRQFNFPNVLIYADPPYVLSTRFEKRKQYLHEMTDDDHVELLDALKRHSGYVILSGYESPLYDELLSGWFKVTKNVRAQSAGARKEVLWMNFVENEQMTML